MFWNLLCEKNNLQLQIIDFEDDESIKATQTTIGSFKSKNKPLKSGYCTQCGSYHLIGCGKTFTVLPKGVTFYKRFGDIDYKEMVEQRCSRGSGYRRLSRH